ncbi:MAG: ABC transporter substrate-binding protein [Bacilli bacterium]
MKRRSRWIVSLMAVASGVAGISLTAPFLTSAARPSVTLSVGNWPTKTGSNYQLENTLKAQFEKKYGVTIVPNSLTWNTNGGVPFYTAAAAGQLPNMNAVPFTEPQKMISAGYAIPITQELKAAGWLKYLNPAFLKIADANGQSYGIPANAYVMGMWYNVALMKKAGLVNKNGIPIFPTTYVQLAKDAVQIKKKTGAIGFFLPTTNNQGGWEFLNIAWSYGARFEKQVHGKWTATFNSPQAVAALQFVKDLRWKYNVVEPDVLHSINTGFRLFGTNQAAMMFGTPDWFSIPIQSYHMSRNNFAMSPVMAGPAGRWAQTGGTFYMFAPGTSSAQVNVGIKWAAFGGLSPFLNHQTEQGFKAGLVNNVKQGFPVGPQDPYVWNANAPVVKADNLLVHHYTNVNMALFNNYLINAPKSIRPEPPIAAQQLYQTLDGVVQAVLTNRNANPKTLLDNAVHDFQLNYLNNQG